MFKIDLDSLNEFIETSKAMQAVFEEQRGMCHNTVLNLTTDGFTGSAQIACLERFNSWINAFDSLVKKNEYFCAISIDALSDASYVQSQCNALPVTIGASASQPRANSGQAVVDDSHSAAVLCQNLLDLEYTGLEREISTASMGANTLKFSCAVLSNIGILRTMVKSQKEKIGSLATGYRTIVETVADYEETYGPLFESLGLEGYDYGEMLDIYSGLHADSQAGDTDARGIENTIGIAKDISDIEGMVYLLRAGIRRKFPKMVIDGDKVRLVAGTYSKLDGLTHTYNVDKLDTNGKLIGIRGYQVLKGIGRGLAVVDIAITVYTTIDAGVREYGRNPYLPETIRQQNTADITVATGVIDFGSIGASTAAGAIAGAIVGAPAFGVTAVPAAAIGAVVGFGTGIILAFTVDTESLAEDYRDFTVNTAFDSDWLRANQYYVDSGSGLMVSRDSVNCHR